MAKKKATKKRARKSGKKTVSVAKLKTSMSHLGLKLPHGYEIAKRKKKPAKKRKAAKRRKR
jgi:RsiW-degrading membrane proteinase PrsW (M82 family)